MDERVADQRVQLELRVARRAEQEERRCEVIEAAARARDHEDAACPEREGFVEGQLEVRGVLRDGMPDYPPAGRLGPGERGRGDGVEIADEDVDLEAERGSAIEAAVGRDHGASVGHGDVGARPRCDDHDVRLDHAFLRWHYPGQVLRVGGAVAALSARLPELPGSLCRY